MRVHSLGLDDPLEESWKWHPTPGFLPGKSHGQRSLGGYRPRGRKEADMAEQLGVYRHFLGIARSGS